MKTEDELWGYVNTSRCGAGGWAQLDLLSRPSFIGNSLERPHCTRISRFLKQVHPGPESSLLRVQEDPPRVPAQGEVGNLDSHCNMSFRGAEPSCSPRPPTNLA